MAKSLVAATIPSPATAPKAVEHPSGLKPCSQKHGTPLIVFLLAIAIMVTIPRNWNAWHGGRVEQVTNDAYVRGDLTPLSTKVSGLESGPHTPLAQTEVHSADYPSLQAMVKEFPAQVKASVDVASFDVAGPVIDGHVKTTNPGP
jgi:hypothetical protein